jgi:hypothetical protein
VVISMACSQPATAIVVAIDSDMSVPAELASVRVEVGGAACSGASCAHDFDLSGAAPVSVPFSLTVTSASGTGPLDLVVRGRDPSGADRVVRRVHSSFVTGRTLLLQVTLDRACIDSLACGDASTCIDGACTSDQIDASTLHDVVAGTELRFDSGMRGDASADAGEAPDAPGVDGGSLPRTCAEVPTTTPSGAFMIDPDGAGGREPFLDYCETSADGGGWTLIAKVDPAMSGLEFENSVWVQLTDAGHAFGTADLSVENALLASYWRVAASELRIVMAPAATPTATRTLLTGLSGTGTLRDAMEASGHVTMDATRAAWATLIGGVDPGATTCEVSGVPAALPASTAIHVRIGYVWADPTDCTQPAFWAGIGAGGASCHTVMGTAGGERICGTGAQRHEYPLVAWLFAR